MVDLNTVVAPNEKCPVREIGDGLVILAPDGGLTHSLEGLGAFIWQQMDGKQSLGDILAEILKNFEVEEETASKDLLDFAGRLLEEELITTT